MIVSHLHRFVFLKTRKTAGTSIEIALSQHCGPQDVITAIPPEDEALRQELGFRGPQNLRVPLTRYGLDDWTYRAVRRKRVRYYNHASAQQVRRWIGQQVWSDYWVFCFERNPYDRAISRYYWSTRAGQGQSVTQYLRTAPRKHLTNWDIYTIGGRLAVNFVGRYERLETDLQYIWEKLGLSAGPHLPRAKGTHRPDRRPYTELLDDEALSLLTKTCAREIAAFGYRF